MVMRVGGIVSGMDIEGMVKKLMEAERMPLERMQQQQTTLTWKRDAFREVNSLLLEMDNITRDMKYSTYYNPKSAVSSMEGAVTATANSSASNGSYEISVTQLATSAMNVGNLDEGIDLQTVIGKENAGNYTFSTFGEDGEPVEHNFEVKEDDTLAQVLNKIGNASNGVVRAFYDESSNQVVLETTRTGEYNTKSEFEVGEKSPEIYFEDNIFFTNFLNLDMENETGGENAKFTYNNGLELESKDNSYTLNGITFEFNNIT